MSKSFTYVKSTLRKAAKKVPQLMARLLRVRAGIKEKLNFLRLKIKVPMAIKLEGGGIKAVKIVRILFCRLYLYFLSVRLSVCIFFLSLPLFICWYISFFL